MSLHTTGKSETFARIVTASWRSVDVEDMQTQDTGGKGGQPRVWVKAVIMKNENYKFQKRYLWWIQTLSQFLQSLQQRGSWTLYPLRPCDSFLFAFLSLILQDSGDICWFHKTYDSTIKEQKLILFQFWERSCPFVFITRTQGHVINLLT